MTDRSGEHANAADTGPRIDVGQLSVVGRVRTGNEDSVLCEVPESLLAAQRGLFCAVADGMGGHAAGEEASQMAVQVAHRIFYETNGLEPREAIRLAVVQANTEVFEAGAGTTGRDHMGSTLTAAVMFNDRVVIGHVGDSRAYIVNRGTIRPLTQDHSWVAEEVVAGRMTPEEARVSPRRNIITRALGLRPDVEVDAYEARLVPGDLIVICSDGLHGLVSDEEILAYVLRLRPSDAVNSLAQLANDRGGPDNISVVVARVRDTIEDETDTARGLPILSEATTPTERNQFEELQAAAVPNRPAQAAPPPRPSAPRSPELSDVPTSPAMPIPAPAAPQDAPPPPEPVSVPPPVQAAAPQASAPPQRTLAPAVRQQQVAQRGSRRGGLSLVLVLVLLLLLGAGIGIGLAYMANVPLFGSS